MLDGLIDPRDRGGPLQPMLIVRDLKKYFPVTGASGKAVRAVDGVSFDVKKGQPRSRNRPPSAGSTPIRTNCRGACGSAQ